MIFNYAYTGENRVCLLVEKELISLIFSKIFSRPFSIEIFGINALYLLLIFPLQELGH